MKAIIISALIFILNLSITNSNLLGIDFGTEFIKVSILKPNSPFKMVENIQSKTKTPSSLAFKDEERLFGSDALGKKVRFPRQVFVYMHEFLGKKYSSEQVKKFVEDFFVSYDMEEDELRKTFNFKVVFNKENYIFSTEEIFGMLFRYIKFLADKYSGAGSNIKDCVVTVPAFFGHRERMAISQATELSNLKLQSLITENSAAALQYSIDKQFNKTENIIFYNMGSSYTQATLVTYTSTFETKKNTTTETKRYVNILGESWENIGGNKVNYNFIRNLMKRFDEMDSRKGKKSVMKDYKVAERILPSVLKYKEILSANKNTPINILGVEDGMNLEGKITRETFEEFNADVFDNIFKPLERVLKIGNMTIEDISQIELIGGSVRIPKVQEVLKTKIPENKIGQHINGDDSMAFGACFHSANFSSLFKGGKKIEFNHGPSYGIRIILSNIPEKTEENPLNLCSEEFNSTDVTEECTRKLFKNATLYKTRNLMDTQKKVGFKYDSDFILKVYQYFDEENSAQINEDDNHLMNVKIEGMKDAIKYFAESNLTAVPKVELKFDFDRRGLLNIKAEAINFITLYLKEQTSPTGGLEYLYTPEFVEPIDQEKVNEEIRVLNETGANRTVLSMARMRRDIGRKKTQNINKELLVKVEYIGVQPLNKEQIEASRKKLDDLDAFDALRIKTMDARNNLESEIYKRKDWLENNNNKKVY
jgi:hypoxia up-regulated 1